jgi:hypothetical protein
LEAISERPAVVYERQALHELAKLEAVTPREGVDTILCMYMLEEFEPRRFSFATPLTRPPHP